MALKQSTLGSSVIHPSFLGAKIVTASEMAHIEKLAIQSGESEEEFIEQAGNAVAAAVMRFVAHQQLPKKIFLLIGKGNKGADAYAAGVSLLDEGFQVKAYCCFPFEVCSEWNQTFGSKFLRKQGRIAPLEEGREVLFEKGVIIDGLLGTGFQGVVSGNVEMVIHKANRSQLPIVSIDLPSGLDGTTGEVRGACIQAVETVTLGLAKSGLFLRDGWNHAGCLRIADFGLPAQFVEQAEEIAFLLDPRRLPLPEIKRNRHKYEAGYVIGFSGSETMRGAPKMAGLAALRAGAGVVRLFSAGDLGNAPMELICQKWNEKDWGRELARANAVFAGPGIGAKHRSRWLQKIGKPIVLDADLLQKGLKCPPHAILTPHRGEMLRLLGLQRMPLEEDFLACCQKYAEREKTILVLKGAPTFIFAHRRPTLVIARGDPGMATAGSGDVLTGVLSALLAQGMDLYAAAASGVCLHAMAGEIAAREKTSFGMIASDLIDCLPKAFLEIIAR